MDQEHRIEHNGCETTLLLQGGSSLASQERTKEAQDFQEAIMLLVPRAFQRRCLAGQLQFGPRSNQLVWPSFGHVPVSSVGSVESQSKPGIKMVYPEPCKELRRRPQLFMAGIVPY